MKTMLDANLLLDYFRKREPFYFAAGCIVNLARQKFILASIPGHAVTTIHYIIEKTADLLLANEAVDWLLENFDVAAINKSLLLKARALPVKDFEDSVVSVLADYEKCEYIITRNVPDFEESPVPAITPDVFLAKYFPEL